MTFATPEFLWFLAAVAGLAALDRSGRAAQVKGTSRIERLWAGARGLSPSRSNAAARFRWCLWTGLALGILALARPQWGTLEQRMFEQSREVLVALDLSRSMLAEDVPPSRLERGRLLIRSLLEKLSGERVGLVVFSGTAFLQSPLSSDYEVLREFIPELNPEFLPEGGTDYEKLLTTALESFSTDPAADRFLVILSDGESQTEAWRGLVERLQEKQIRVIGLGIGTVNGAVIPDGSGALVKDERGAVVLSRLTSGTLQELAEATGGRYLDAAGWVDLPALLEATVEAGSKGTFSEREELIRIERYQFFLAGSLFLLFLSFWREFPVQVQTRDIPGRRRPLAPATAAVLVLAGALGLGFPLEAVAQIEALPDRVARLAEKERPTALDWAGLARSTIEFARNASQTEQPASRGLVQDGLRAVTAGERLDAGAADWPKLRRELEELLEPPEAPPQNQQSPEEQPPEENQQGDPSQQQSGSGNESPHQESSDAEEPGQNPEQKDSSPSQEENSSPENPSSPAEKGFGELAEKEPENQPPPSPNPDGQSMQEVGGVSARNSELAEIDPELAVPLQRLEQVRDQDSPARLFQILSEQDGKPKQPSNKKDW